MSYKESALCPYCGQKLSYKWYMKQARQYVKGKSFITPKKLAKYLGCNHTQAGKILKEINWIPWNPSAKSRNRTYVPSTNAGGGSQ